MQHACQNFFTGASGAFNEGCDVGLRHALSQCQKVTAGGIDIHHAFLGAACATTSEGGAMRATMDAAEEDKRKA